MAGETAAPRLRAQGALQQVVTATPPHHTCCFQRATPSRYTETPLNRRGVTGVQGEAGFRLSSLVPAQRSWGYPIVRGALEGAGLSEGHTTRFSAEQVEGSWGDPSSKAFVRIECVVSEVTCSLLPWSGRGWW